jgi:hypothetical protein
MLNCILGGEVGQPHSYMACVVFIFPTFFLMSNRRHHDQILSQIKLFLVDEVLVIPDIVIQELKCYRSMC